MLWPRWAVEPLWDHAAIEHLVRDWRGNPADESRTHLRIAAQHFDGSLLFSAGRCVFRFLFPQLFTICTLIFLHDFIGDAVHDRVLTLRKGAPGAHHSKSN